MARILIIEDNLTNLELMQYLLNAFGHTVSTACDGIEGVEAVQRELPELIICDVHLPKMDGYEIAKHLKSDPVLKGIPLIAVTALAMVGDRDKGLAAGFDGYISKPIEPEKFVSLVERFLHEQKRGETPPRPPTAAADIKSEDARHTHASILVVDDSAVNRELMRTLLEPFGYDVWLASSVAEGLARAIQDLPDLIMSDLHMPEEDGFALVRQVKAIPRLADIPFLIISSTAWGEKDRVTALQLGVAHFFRRPIEPHILLDEIAACLAKKG